MIEAPYLAYLARAPALAVKVINPPGRPDLYIQAAEWRAKLAETGEESGSE